MRHGAYVATRDAREPRFADERAAAAAELRLGAWFVERRESLGISMARLAEDAGISEGRLEALEEGDTLTVNELLWLCRALEVSLSVGSDFTIDVASDPRIRRDGEAIEPAGVTVGGARA